MGWYYQQRNKQQYPTIRSFFESLWNNEYCEILDCAVVQRREAYFALRNKKTNTVFALVCLLDYRPNDIYNFGYKEMEECMGPCYYKCPKRILNLLSPTDDKHAIRWRNSCFEYHASKNKAKVL